MHFKFPMTEFKILYIARSPGIGDNFRKAPSLKIIVDVDSNH